MKKVVKPVLAGALWKITNDNHIVIIPVTDVHHIIDGGALLHHVSLSKGSTYEAIYSLYLKCIQVRYNTYATFVFDGYDEGPSTKHATHLMRNVGNCCYDVNLPKIWNVSSRRMNYFLILTTNNGALIS